LAKHLRSMNVEVILRHVELEKINQAKMRP